MSETLYFSHTPQAQALQEEFEQMSGNGSEGEEFYNESVGSQDSARDFDQIDQELLNMEI